MLTISGSGIPIAPQALQELQPIIPQGYYYPDFMGVELEYRFSLYGELYMRNSWVHTVIDKRANAVARLPVNVWDVDGDTRTLDSRSAYARLIADPCPYLSQFEFWHRVQTNIDIYGEMYLAIVRDITGAPTSFLPMHPSRVALRRDPKTGEYTYFFQAGSGINTELVKFAEEDIVPFRLYNPNKLERGLSRMEAIRQTVFAEDSARNAANSMLRNGGRPNIVLKTDKRLNDAGYQRLKTKWENAHAGTSNEGKTLILEEGMDAAALQVSPVDLELIEARKMNREEIAAVYDIAPTLIGILEHATFSNITEQIRGFYRDTMAPPIEFIQSVMDKYVGSYWTRKNIMRFSVDEVMRGDYEKRVEAAHSGIAVGLYTPNEARELVGLNRYDDPKADKLYANSAIQPLGEPAEQVRIMGQLTGATPDGVGGPPTMPVASLDGGKPNSVTPHGAPATPGSGGPQPNNANPSTTARPKHFREVKGQVGRGRTNAEIKAFAIELFKKYPDELDDILESVRLAIAERDKKNKDN
jgi:HK97 family phage portal protein